MRCTGLSQGPTTSSTPEFGQMQDQGFHILWFETGRKSARAICFRFRITLWSSCVGGPPPLRSHSFSIAAYRNVTLKWTPKPLQRSGSSPSTHNPGTERDRRGPIRHHRRRLEPHVGGRASGAVQEGQAEGAVEPCRQRKTGADNRRRQASQKRFPF